MTIKRIAHVHYTLSHCCTVLFKLNPQILKLQVWSANINIRSDHVWEPRTDTEAGMAGGFFFRVGTLRCSTIAMQT